jgi:hypothetical protein
LALVDASSTCGRSRNLERALGVFMARMFLAAGPSVAGPLDKIRGRRPSALSAG